MNTQLYLIHAKTHIHAGSGNTNSGVIDNLVQRDPADNLPCIFASSLKGAFREYFEESLKDIKLANQIFGAGLNKDTDKSNPNKDNSKGTHIFHQASLLTIPARSNIKPFYNATSPSVLQRFIDDYLFFTGSKHKDHDALNRLAKMTPAQEKPIVFHQKVSDLKIEDYPVANFENDLAEGLQSLLGKNFVLFCDEDFSYLCSDMCLPVIARNNLENGESKNLWYEQIVPRETCFWFYTASSKEPVNDDFYKKISNKQVQIGANASIGYGLCLIKNI